MLEGIDRIVIVVRALDLEAASHRRLGFIVVAGGRHPAATHGALGACPARA